MLVVKNGILSNITAKCYTIIIIRTMHAINSKETRQKHLIKIAYYVYLIVTITTGQDLITWTFMNS